MNQPLLSILIPTVVGREENCSTLIRQIIEQHEGVDSPLIQFSSSSSLLGFIGRFELGEIEILDLRDNKEMTIGEKRGKLYKGAKGKFSWQIDDDDTIADDAIQLILAAIKENPDVDCVTFQEHCLMYGKHFKSNHSLSYSGWYGDGSHLLSDGFHFHRAPFYKDVIKTSIAQSVPFKHIRFGEDHLWSIDLHSHLKTEVHIDKDLYFYIYDPKDSHQERYGIKD